MTESEHNKDLDKAPKKPNIAGGNDPQWTSSLKKLYDSVLHEPMPDSFKELLDKLDDDKGK